MPGSTADLAIPYALPADARAAWPASNQTMSERIEALLKGVQFNTGEGLTGDGSAATPLKTALSGIWGQNPGGEAALDIFGPDTQKWTGAPIYTDLAGLLRSQPLIISGPEVNRLATDFIDKYPLGPSVMGISVAQAGSGGWPLGVSAVVVTNKRDEGAGNQLWMRWGPSAPEYHIMYRGGSDTAWGPWADVFFDTGWKDLTPKSGTGPFQYRCINGVVTVRMALTTITSIAVNASGTILDPLVLPAAYRPTVAVYQAGNMGGSYGCLGVINSPDAGISLWNPGNNKSAMTTARLTFTYLKE